MISLPHFLMSVHCCEIDAYHHYYLIMTSQNAFYMISMVGNNYVTMNSLLPLVITRNSLLPLVIIIYMYNYQCSRVTVAATEVCN